MFDQISFFNNIFNTGQVDMTSSLDYPRVVAEYIYEDIICTESVMDVQASHWTNRFNVYMIAAKLL